MRIYTQIYIYIYIYIYCIYICTYIYIYIFIYTYTFPIGYSLIAIQDPDKDDKNTWVVCLLQVCIVLQKRL